MRKQFRTKLTGDENRDNATAASAIKDVVWEPIEVQIKTFGQQTALTPSELTEFSNSAG